MGKDTRASYTSSGKVMNIGDRVQVTEYSDWYNRGRCNPNCGGLVVDYQGIAGLPIRVEWDNGEFNSYAECDLILESPEILYGMKEENRALGARIAELERALFNLIDTAEQCDGWESFPSDPIEVAYRVYKKEGDTNG